MWKVLARLKHRRYGSSHGVFDTKSLIQPTVYDDDPNTFRQLLQLRKDSCHVRAPCRVHSVSSLVLGSLIGWLEKRRAREMYENLMHLGSCNDHAMICNLKIEKIVVSRFFLPTSTRFFPVILENLSVYLLGENSNKGYTNENCEEFHIMENHNSYQWLATEK